MSNNGESTGPRPDDHVIVLFGATGDLARRKLLPGLFHLQDPRLSCQPNCLPERRQRELVWGGCQSSEEMPSGLFPFVPDGVARGP